MSVSPTQPRDVFVHANRLRLHLLEWGSGDRVILCVHGFLEHAHVWDFAAPLLVAQGYRVYALDWRGHGDSDWVGAGGYYHFLDYVADLAALVPQLGEQVILLAHSMGGGAAVLYAGTEPQRVAALISIEGLGVPDTDADLAPQRVVNWIEDLRKVEKRRRGSVDIEVAATRMCERWPGLPAAMARHIVMHGTRAEGEQRFWKFDPLHQTQAPLPTPVSHARAFWPRVQCPLLYIAGGNSLLAPRYGDIEERLTALRAQYLTMAGVAHHAHLEQPEELAQAVVEFLRPMGPA